MLFKNPILIVSYFAALLVVSWQLTLFTLVFVPVFGWFMGFVGKKLKAKSGKGLFIALMLFVGIPLPVTGAWTGTLAASILDMGFKKTMLAVFCGVLIAGVIVSLVVLLPNTFGFLAKVFTTSVPQA